MENLSADSVQPPDENTLDWCNFKDVVNFWFSQDRSNEAPNPGKNVEDQTPTTISEPQVGFNA